MIKHNEAKEKFPVIPKAMVLPFAIVTFCFAMWGFANDITNPMVAAFKNILLISNFQSSLVQTAFYGGYFVMAIPAAIFIKRFSYRTGIIMGLSLYTIGCLLFIPSGWAMAFWAFLLSYFIMTCGLAFLETGCNPYIISMGPEETSTRRLNFAQSFNPVGSIFGMLVAKNMILSRLNPMTEAERLVVRAKDPALFSKIADQDLDVIIGPYAMLGIVVFAFLMVFIFCKLPRTDSGKGHDLHIRETFGRLFHNHRYIASVIAQTFYVGVQIMVWTFIIQYAEKTLGMQKADAQFYNIIAMTIFVSSRFICTFLLKFFNSGKLLVTLALAALVFTGWAIFGGGNPDAGALLTQQLQGVSGAGALGVYLKALVTIPGMSGILALIAVSACMSLMYPTIYGIGLLGLGDDAKIGAAGLVMAIGGGCLMPPIQGWIMDLPALHFFGTELASVRASFFLPLFCFVVLVIYGWKTYTTYLPAVKK